MIFLFKKYIIEKKSFKNKSTYSKYRENDYG